MNYDIFISYSREDSVIADRICTALEKEGINYFIDRRGIAGGMEFPERLANAIVNSKIFLFLASNNSYESPYTNKEITFAFNHKCKMLPYIIDESTLPLKLEFTFADINWLNIKEHPIESRLIKDLVFLLNSKDQINYNDFNIAQAICDNIIAVALDDGNIVVIDFTSKKNTFFEHEDVTDIKFDRNGKLLVSMSQECIKVWNIQKSICQEIIWKQTDDRITSFDISPDSKNIVFGSDDNYIRIWNLAKHQFNSIFKETLNESEESGTVYVSYSPDGKFIISSGNGIRVWSVESESILKTIKNSNKWASAVFKISPNNKFICENFSNQPGKFNCNLWNVNTGLLVHGQIGKGHTKAISSISFSPNSKNVLTSSCDNTIKIWDVINGKCLKSTSVHQDAINYSEYSTDGKFIISASDDGKVIILDSHNCAILCEICFNQLVMAAIFGPNFKFNKIQ